MSAAPTYALEHLAHHEAGHAVALMHLKSRPLLAVSVWPKGRWLGRHRRGGRCSHGEAGLLACPREQALADMAVAWAGRAAEWHLLGREPPWPILSDSYFDDGRTAWRLARTLTRTRAEAEALYFAQRDRALALLGRANRWPAVTAIAAELVRRSDHGRRDARLEGREAWQLALRALGVRC